MRSDRERSAPLAPQLAWTPLEVLVGVAIAVGVLATSGVWIATQLAVLVRTGAAAAFGFDDAAVALVGWAHQPLSPLAALPTRVAAAIGHPAVWWTAAIITTVIGLAPAVWAVRRGGRAAPPSAGWAHRRHLAPLRVPRAGDGRLVLGRRGGALLAAEPSQAVIVLGPARSGKTAGLAIPAILEWDGPVLATSIRTDLLDATHTARGRRGDVWVYDPTGTVTTGGATHGWNPLASSGTWQDAQRLATSLCSAGRHGAGGGTEDFWYAMAAKLLAPLLYAASTGGYSMVDVIRWIDTQEELEVRAELVGHDDPAAMHAAEATWRREARIRSSAYTTAEVVLHAFQDPTVLASTADGQISADGLLDGSDRTLYVCAPSHEQDRLRPVFTALLDQVVQRAYALHAAGTPATKPLLIVLDEAANIATPRDLDTIASTAAGTGIQLMTIWQDMAQIQARYGNRAATVVNNHRAKLVLSGVSDEPTLRYISQLVGDREYRQDQVSFDSAGRHSTSTGHPSYRALAPADALRRTPPGEGLLIYGHLPPTRLQLRPWYRDRQLRTIAGK